MKNTLCRVAALAATLSAVPAFAAEQIKVVERPVGETTVDLGAKGDSIGDLLVFANGIFDAANKAQLGSDQGYCVRTIVGKSWECFWTMTLKAGQITVEGPFMDEGDSLFSVTGGTGKYVGAKGSMKLHPRDAKSSSYDFTYDLL
jgi:allene oxide cyclase